MPEPRAERCIQCSEVLTHTRYRAALSGVQGNVCESCAQTLRRCEHCGVLIPITMAVRRGSVTLCLECYIATVRGQNRGVCSDCGVEITHNTDRFYTVTCGTEINRVVCSSCADGYEYCERCQTLHLCGDSCSWCNTDRVHEYSFTPPLKYLRHENSTEELYLGVELEIDSNTDRGDVNAALRLLPDWTYPKHDSSLRNGFEIVTHPMSLLWFNNHAHELCGKFAQLCNMGYSSGECGTCGVHIHLSRVAFGHLHLYKFLYLVYNYPSLTLMLSQRAYGRLNRWANGEDSSHGLISRAKSKTQAGRDRHTAVNVSNTKPTVELRIFNGTLNPLTFMKNIDTTMAIYSYTRDVSLSEMSAPHFISYVKDNRCHYPYLTTFLTLRGAERSTVFSLDSGPAYTSADFPESQRKYIERLYSRAVKGTQCA